MRVTALFVPACASALPEIPHAPGVNVSEVVVAHTRSTMDSENIVKINSILDEDVAIREVLLSACGT